MRCCRNGGSGVELSQLHTVDSNTPDGIQQVVTFLWKKITCRWGHHITRVASLHMLRAQMD